MTSMVSGVFADRQHVDSVLGALREASFEPERIGVIGPDGQPVALARSVKERHGVGSWLMDHLTHRAQPHAEPEQYQGQIPEGRWLVTVGIGSTIEDRDARTLMVSAGAEEISSATDGTLVSVR